MNDSITSGIHLEEGKPFHNFVSSNIFTTKPLSPTAFQPFLTTSAPFPLYHPNLLKKINKSSQTPFDFERNPFAWKKDN